MCYIKSSVDVSIKKGFIPGIFKISWEATLWNGTVLDLSGDPNFKKSCSKRKKSIKWEQHALVEWKAFKETIFGEKIIIKKITDKSITCNKDEHNCSPVWF